jgi:photosystem II stability/assembly factor-like uncharacterized protein
MRLFCILTAGSLLICTAQEPSPVYIGTGNGVYRSLDGGTRWERLPGELAAPGALSLAVSPADPNLIYAGTGRGLFRSIDGGRTWSAAGPNEQPVSAIVVDPSSPSRLYALAYDILWASADDGSHWTRSLSPSGPPYPVWPMLDPADASTIYAATRGGVFKSIDGGQSWSGTAATADSWLIAAGSEAGRLYRAGVGGIWTSPDGGASWIGMNPPDSLVSALFPADAWPFNTSDSLSFRVEAITAQSQNSGSVHACIAVQWFSSSTFAWDWSAAVMTYRNGAWTSHPLGKQAGCRSWGLAADPAVPSLAYVSSGTGLSRTFDGGQTWSAIPELQDIWVHSIALR